MTVRESIESGNAAFCEAFNGGDAAGVAAQYTSDARILPPGASSIDGRRGIQEFWQGFIDAKVADVILRSDEIEDFGSQAVDVGTLSASAPGEADARVQLVGKYIVLWTQDANGAWRMRRDIWNWDA
jgi:ketosteroid isomerase-like protein